MRVLAFFPHPDDEAWAAGGLLAACAHAGAEVHLLCATRGEAGRFHPRCGLDLSRPLAETRVSELVRACDSLGLGAPSWLDLPDGQLCEVAGEAVVPRLVAALEARRPDVVVAFGPDGGYGHRDHLACTRWLRAALAAHPVPWLQAAFPPGLLEPMRRALRRTGLVDRAVALGVVDPGLVLDVGPFREQKRAAIGSHASQLAGGDPRTLLCPGAVDALLDREAYVVAAGPAVAVPAPLARLFRP